VDGRIGTKIAVSEEQGFLGAWERRAMVVMMARKIATAALRMNIGTS
jgi:hypothetical protein